jgi:beta-glucosidase
VGTPCLAQSPTAPSEQQIDVMLKKLTLERKLDLIGGEDALYIRALPEIGMPRLKMSDGPVGIRTYGPTNAYAGGIALAASWDTGLAYDLGVALAHDARARGVNFLLGPATNIYRAPWNGRNFEYFGEDPFLTSRITVNYIEGVQSQGVIATVKHFIANDAEYDRMQENALIDERTLREIYLPPFEAAVKEAHVGAVMDSYNLVNGEHATQSHALNIDILKKDWGFTGILMSDWNATHDSIPPAVNGLDLEMPSGKFMNRNTLMPALKNGTFTKAILDDKVRRILREALAFHFFDRPQLDASLPIYNQQAHGVALRGALESMVLLKNEGALLPLNAAQLKTVAVIGPNTFPAVTGGGGSSNAVAFEPVSFLTGISDRLRLQTVVHWNRGVKDPFGQFSDLFTATNWSTDAAGKTPGLKREIYFRSSGKVESTSTVLHVERGRESVSSLSSPAKRSVRFTGYFTPPTSGTYTVLAHGEGRDAYTVRIDGRLVLEVVSHLGQPVHSARMQLTAGKPVAIDFDYVPATDGLRASLALVPSADLLEDGAIDVAKAADVVVLSVGFDLESESEGFDRTYELPFGQQELIEAVTKANPKTIVVLTAGGSVETAPWIDHVPVLLQTWYSGQEGGTALAEILTGDADPSGKLPISWERRIKDIPTYSNYHEAPGSHDVTYREGIFIGYRYYDRTSVKPLFPFGFGLSYTTFRFSHLQVKRTGASEVSVDFDVTNTGPRAGAEVAQVYVGAPSGSVPRPVRELKQFARVPLAPGATQHIERSLPQRAFEYWDVATHAWKLSPGTFTILVGNSSENLPLSAEVQLP